ncbi:hypothetical protein JG687_00009494 [Phytophthora cactorum]|uniref:Uncharacterized protein n=1 Tax=Phytophthora cactorum TaxID=29920 RepID=A0A8T1UBZ3_9STRA|nr:hypothetical protein JG687_00009494 [Phytophthora cactorum]
MRSTSLSRLLSKLHDTWKSLQVSYYGGKYSIHRLLALGAYTRNTSLARVLLVCLGTPLPMVAFVSIQAVIPLQDPAQGWRANHGFWIRSGILSFMVAHTLTTQATYLIDGVVISVAIGISAWLLFPMPFFMLTLAPVFYVALILSYRLVLGAQILHQMIENRDQLIRYSSFVAAQNVMVLTYPTYETLFRVAKGSLYQLPVILLLPFIKVAVKNMVLRCMASMEDMLPEAVIFTVDFSMLFMWLLACRVRPLRLRSAITVTDLSQTIIMLFGLHQRTTEMLSRLCQTIDGDPNCFNLVNALCVLCQARSNEIWKANAYQCFYTLLPPTTLN